MKVCVVLGLKQQSEDIGDKMKNLCDIASDLLNKNIVDLAILSGGMTNPSLNMTEAQMMYNYLSDKVDPSKLVKEEESLDTIGNAYFSRIIIDKLKDVSNVYVITSDYHKDRSKFIFDEVFDERYKLNFRVSYDDLDPDEELELKKHEAKSLSIANRFFEGINPGDMEEIKYKLYTYHDFYKKKNV